MLVRANADGLLHEGLQEVLFEKYKEANPIYKQIFNIVNSKKKYEKDMGFSGYGSLIEKPEATPLSDDDPIQGYSSTLTHKAFGLKSRITKEMNDDDQYSVIAKMPKALAKATVRTLETFSANVFNQGFTAFGSFLTGGDGQFLFSTAHPLTGGGVQSNRLSTPADLSITSFEEALYLLRKTRGDRGEFLALQPKHLLFPPELSMIASEILESSLRPDTADNAKNWAANQGIKAVSGTGWVYLTDPDAWFILTDKDEHNLKFIMRNELETDSWRDHDTKDFLFSVFTRFSVGYSDFRGIFGTEGA